MDLDNDNNVDRNNVDQRLITDLLLCYGAVFTLVNAKFAHLQNGDPFKERCNVYCLLLVKVVIGYMNYMLPPPPNVPEGRQGVLGGMFQGTGTMLRRLVGTGRGTGRGRRTRTDTATGRDRRRLTGAAGGAPIRLNRAFDFDVLPLEAAQDANAVMRRTRNTEGGPIDQVLPALQMNRTAFVNSNFNLVDLAEDIVDQDARNITIQQIERIRHAMNLIDSNEIDIRGDVLIKSKFRLLEMKMNDMRLELETKVNDYYVTELGCNNNIDGIVNMINGPNLADQAHVLGIFDFKTIVELQNRIVGAVRRFYDVTRNIIVGQPGIDQVRANFNMHARNARRRAYENILIELLDNVDEDYLNPFMRYDRDIAFTVLTPGGTPVDTVSLLLLASRLAPEVVEEY